MRPFARFRTPYGAPSRDGCPVLGAADASIDIGAERQTRAGLARETQKPSARPGDITVGQYPLGRRGAPGRRQPLALPPCVLALRGES